jgi:RHS repeat-associated protein
LTYNYASGLNGDISRLSSLSDSGGTLESYDYLGLGTVVRRSHPQPDLDLTFLGTGPGSGGDQYVGLDSFGRVIDHRWKTTGGTTDRFAYTYDRNSNRLTKDNAVNSDFDEAYTYDSLNQLAGFDRNSGDRTQAWDFDALGNWDSLTTDGGSPVTRTHNKQNEITAVSGATTPTFDANGNMTTDETGKQYVYDAWNRLKIVKNSGGTTLKAYVYDALGRRVAETASGVTTDFYYSSDWQVLEERDAARTNNTKARYVWSPVYVDAMILRDRDTADDGTLDERLWVQQDANFNVTALVDDNGDVVERYVYDPYGVATVLDETWSVIGTSAYGWLYLHQGGRLDATSGLYHFRNRDYSPTLGRWVTIDPIRYSGGATNLVAYNFNAPINYLDASGLAPNPNILNLDGGDLHFDTDSNLTSLETERVPYVFIDLNGKYVYKDNKSTTKSVVIGLTGPNEMYKNVKFIQFDKFTAYKKSKNDKDWVEFTPKKNKFGTASGWPIIVDGKTWTPDTKKKSDDPTYASSTAAFTPTVGKAFMYDSPNMAQAIHQQLVKDNEHPGCKYKVVEEFRTLFVLKRKVIAYASWKASFETGDKEVKYYDGGTGKGEPTEWGELKNVINKHFPKQNIVTV